MLWTTFVFMSVLRGDTCLVSNVDPWDMLNNFCNHKLNKWVFRLHIKEKLSKDQQRALDKLEDDPITALRNVIWFPAVVKGHTNFYLLLPLLFQVMKVVWSKTFLFVSIKPTFSSRTCVYLKKHCYLYYIQMYPVLFLPSPITALYALCQGSVSIN